MGPHRTSRRQRKNLEAAQGIAGPGAPVLALGGGTGHPRITKGVIGLAVGFVLLFAVVLAFLHFVLIPGVVIVLVAVQMIRPRRGSPLRRRRSSCFTGAYGAGGPTGCC